MPGIVYDILGQVRAEVAGLAVAELAVRDLDETHGRVLGDEVERSRSNLSR